MPDITKIKRSAFAHYLNTTPTAQSPTWVRVGYTTSGTYSLNPQTEVEQYIKDDSSTTSVTGYQPSIDNPLVAHKGEPIFEYVHTLFKNRSIGSECETEVLFVDIFDASGTSSVTYGAQKNKCTIVVTDMGGDAGANVVLNFDININGDPVIGTATISNGTPTFTEA